MDITIYVLIFLVGSITGYRLRAANDMEDE